MDLLYRFLIGGAIVSLFALLGEVLRPKGFAGLLGAAPSVALATLPLTLTAEGKSYAAIDGVRRARLLRLCAGLHVSHVQRAVESRPDDARDAAGLGALRSRGGSVAREITVTVHADLSALRGVKPHEYLMRFALGGAVTLLAGVVADRWGPVVGGLFLAFPAILPATATLLEKHERHRQCRAGIKETSRGRRAAALDARGAATGALALAGFAALVWKLLPAHAAPAVLAAALAGWFGLAVLFWRVRKRLTRLVVRRAHRRQDPATKKSPPPFRCR